MPHPLDRPVWSSLTTRQAHLAQGDARAWRIDPDYGIFVAAADESVEAQAALDALIVPGFDYAIVEPAIPPNVPGTEIARQTELVQMVAEAAPEDGRSAAFVALGDADSADMVALAALTKPGPFLARTHQLGDFIGIREDGRLIAMAGERMRVDGYTEVSAICTDPDYRGRGLGKMLTREVTRRILARGERAFLHAYPDNAPAIALYESLGFRARRMMIVTFLSRALSP